MKASSTASGDRRAAPRCASSDLFRRLRVGVIAVLGASDEPLSQAHLRKIYENEPEYRTPVAMSLSQHPGGENFKLLVDSLRTAEGPAAQEILGALAKVDERPTGADAYRHVGDPASMALDSPTSRGMCPATGRPRARAAAKSSRYAAGESRE